VSKQREVPMNKPHRSVPSEAQTSESKSFILGFWRIRYQVEDVNRFIDFYTRRLGFRLDHKHPPPFAQVSIGNLKLILGDPGASGSRAMPRWQSAKIRWFEPRDTGGVGPLITNRDAGEIRVPFPQFDGVRSRRQANPTRRPGSKPNRVVRTC
jgi:catechol 2,3-dioxygenase-like lactoylglutathione lyase family enzyme